MARTKPQLSFWKIWNMSFGFLGIQMGFALQNGNVSRIFQTLGADIDRIPILWIAAPVTGLLVQPIIGHMSDRTWNRLGRRHPYFLTGAILASLALGIITNSPTWIFATMIYIPLLSESCQRFSFHEPKPTYCVSGDEKRVNGKLNERR